MKLLVVLLGFLAGAIIALPVDHTISKLLQDLCLCILVLTLSKAWRIATILLNVVMADQSVVVDGVGKRTLSSAVTVDQSAVADGSAILTNVAMDARSVAVVGAAMMISSNVAMADPSAVVDGRQSILKATGLCSERG